MTVPYDRLARFYDLVAPEPDDLDFYLSLAQRHAGSVLDWGVGSGRVALALAAAGVSVVGVDESAAMLARARERAAAQGLDVTLIAGDVATFACEQRFGLIICAADTFLHLTTPERQLAALQRGRAQLAEGGRLVLDLPALGAGDWDDWQSGVRPLELVWSGASDEGRPLQQFTTFVADGATQQRHMTHLFDELDADGRVTRTVVEFTLRLVAPAELPLLAAAAGLRVAALYGDYDLSPFATGCPRLLAVLAAD